jgi:hypothetical protein
MTPLLSILLLACSEQGVLRKSQPPESSDATSDGADSAIDTTTGSGTASGTASATGTGTGTEPAAPRVTRFVAIGDAGTGDSHQMTVAAAVARTCATQGCDFAVYLGDNFYSDGVTSVDDSLWASRFEAPYGGLGIQFWAVLGNHDYGGNGGGWEPFRTDAEVAYTAQSAAWNMPDQFYAQDLGDVTLFGLDTTAFAWERADDQLAWFPTARDAAQTRWKIAIGHHTVVSNGPHGNAGEWDGGSGGRVFGDFVNRELCGKVDAYLGGHDHSLQWPVSPCQGTEFLVSGAGGKSSGVGGGNPVWFQRQGYGFLWVELRGDTFTGVFYDDSGTELYRRSFERSR